MIGIFGGTFDPIHHGHLRAAFEVQGFFNLSQVRFIPCHQPVHRNMPQVSAQQRLTMIELAIANAPHFIADSREIYRAGRSFMFDTLQSLRADFPNQPLLLFIGTDAFNGFTSWHRWQELFDFAHIVVMNRPDSELRPLNPFFKSHLTQEKNDLRDHLEGHLFFQAITPLAISATAIREMLINRKSPRFLLPDAVLDYIEQKQLYLSNS